MAGVVSLFILAATNAAMAQTKVPVEVSHSGNDAVGQGIAYAVREVIRGSNGMGIVTDPSRPRIRIILVSVDESDGNTGVSSAVAVSLVFDSPLIPLGGYHITTFVQTCGRNRAAGCGRRIVELTDAEVEKMRTNWPGVWQQLVPVY
jgi:hypothetical protein